MRRFRRRTREIVFIVVAALSPGVSLGAEKGGAVSSQDSAGDVTRQILERVPDAAESISVERNEGRVVLSGTVDHLAQRWLAQEAAEDVRGVSEVVNRIRIAGPAMDDAKIRQDVVGALKADPATLALDLDVQVRDGTVTLRGAVDTVPQKRIAEWVASDRIGVREVVNEIRVAPARRPDREIFEELRAHYATEALFNDDEIAVQVRNGVVTLAGHVDTAREKNWAREDAWLPGVRQVDIEQLGVKYEPTLSHAGPNKKPDDTEIRRTIVRTYVNDPRVASVHPSVTVKNGVVTLEGAVANLRAKRAAVRIARNTGGVADVVDRLRVPQGASRSDAEIAAEIGGALRTSAALARNQLDVNVTEHRAVLTGTVDSAYERWLAADLAERVSGVVDVENQIRVTGANASAKPSSYFPRGGAATPWTFGHAPREADERQPGGAPVSRRR